MPIGAIPDMIPALDFKDDLGVIVGAITSLDNAIKE